MLNIEVNEQGHVALAGRFDASQADQAKRFFEQIHSSVTVDFQNLEYISSAGLGVLLFTQKRLKAKGSGLRFINMNKHIRDVFRYAGFNTIFDISE